MRLYTRLWRSSCALGTVAGIGLAALEWPVLRVLFTMGLLLALGWLLVCLLPDRVVPFLPRPSTLAAASLAVWALSLVSFALGVMAVLTVAVSHPALIGRAIGSRRRTDVPDAAPLPPVVPAGDAPQRDEVMTPAELAGPLKALDDRQLCRVWRESFWALRTPTSQPATVLCLVALREACLDELERRHSEAVHAWLDHGARASGGPEKYLGEQ